MPEAKTLVCRVCGALNVPTAKACAACGVPLAAKPTGDQVDSVLKDIMSTGTQAAPGAGESLDLDEEIIDDLMDSLRIETKAAGIEVECPICSHQLPSDAKRCDNCGTEFLDVTLESVPSVVPTQARGSRQGLAGAPAIGTSPEAPVAALATETEPKSRFLAGRLVDVVVGGTCAALVGVFFLFRLYSWSVLTSDSMALIMFLAVAAGGMGGGFVLFRISTSLVVQGDRLVKAGRYAEALPYYDRAIRLGHRPSNAWTSKGVALKRLGRLEDALVCQKAALRLDKRNEIACCNLGDVHFRMGNMEKALEAYDRALDLRPRYAIAWNNKGAAFARMNRFEEARECHDRAVRLQPKYVVAWLNRGEVLARLGHRDEANRCLERARALGA